LAKSAETASAPEVSLEEFTKLVSGKGATIIDANDTAMFKSGHVPGAISFASSAEKLAQVLPADKSALIVAYCGGPRCTAWEDAAAAAKKLGYTNIKHFKGGISGWKSAGQKVEKEG
jgi:rhodanese-related sulfurtransferase